MAAPLKWNRTYAAESVEAIKKARENSALLYVEFYCNNSNCAVREVTVRVKDYDESFIKHLSTKSGRSGAICPACDTVMKLHWVHSAEAEQREADERARWSVNRQMLQRDIADVDPEALPVLSAREMSDDRLPPTPEGYFSGRIVTGPPKRKFVSRSKETT